MMRATPGKRVMLDVMRDGSKVMIILLDCYPDGICGGPATRYETDKGL